MPPNYIIVMRGRQASVRRSNVEFDDDVHALVVARKLFVQKLVENRGSPLFLQLGKARGDGAVEWMTSWRSRG